MFSFKITTLGCKVNQYEGQSVTKLLCDSGGLHAEKSTPADLCVINTCCITSTAARKSRQAIRKIIRNNPDSRIMVLGCLSDYNRDQIENTLQSMGLHPDRYTVAGHHDNLNKKIDAFVKDVTNNYITENNNDIHKDGKNRPSGGNNPYSIKTRRILAVKHKAHGAKQLPAINRFENHQRAFVKIQDGCDAFCTYCVVPYTRPNVWSREIDDIIDECNQLAQTGHKEIVLAGVFIGAYGRDTSIRKKWNDSPDKLPELLKRIADIDGLWRVRLSSLEPGDVTDELINVYKNNPKLAPHLHLPLQAGSSRILKKMNRQYDADQFRGAVDKLRNSLDNPAISADIIVGFPTETEDDFQQTLDIAEYCGFSKIHAFPFSPNPGTAAWIIKDQAPSPEETKQRMNRLTQLESKLAQTYRQKFVGRTLQALVESTIPAEGLRQAMTDRYITTHFPNDNSKDLTGKIVDVKILKTTQDGVLGELVD